MGDGARIQLATDSAALRLPPPRAWPGSTRPHPAAGNVGTVSDKAVGFSARVENATPPSIKTPGTAGCYVFRLTLVDGSAYKANFQLK